MARERRAKLDGHVVTRGRRPLEGAAGCALGDAADVVGGSGPRWGEGWVRIVVDGNGAVSSADLLRAVFCGDGGSAQPRALWVPVNRGVLRVGVNPDLVTADCSSFSVSPSVDDQVGPPCR